MVLDFTFVKITVAINYNIYDLTGKHIPVFMIIIK